MSDLMLLGALRAPTPEPDDILGIAQLADRARQAADELEAKDKRIIELEAIVRCPICISGLCSKHQIKKALKEQE